MGGGYNLTQVLQNLRSDNAATTNPLVRALAGAYATGRLDGAFTMGVLLASNGSSGKWAGSNNSKENLDAILGAHAASKSAGCRLPPDAGGRQGSLIVDELAPDDSSSANLNVIITPARTIDDDAAVRAALDILFSTGDEGKRRRLKQGMTVLVKDYVGSFAAAGLAASAHKMRTTSSSRPRPRLAGDARGDHAGFPASDGSAAAGTLPPSRTASMPGLRRRCRTPGMPGIPWSGPRAWAMRLGLANAGLQTQQLNIGNAWGQPGRRARGSPGRSARNTATGAGVAGAASKAIPAAKGLLAAQKAGTVLPAAKALVVKGYKGYRKNKKSDEAPGHRRHAPAARVDFCIGRDPVRRGSPGIH